MNNLLLYLLLILIMILFAHILDRNIIKKFDVNENFDINENNKYIGSVIRLKVNLPILNTNLIGFNENNKNKYFYLAFVKLNPNCTVININNTCDTVFVDQKKCDNNGLSIESNKDTYRLVLIHESIIDAIGLNNTTNFVFHKINDKIYLKSINNGHYPRLFTNDVYVPVIGTTSDINKNKNILCGNNAINAINTKTTSNNSVGVSNLDGNTYLLSTLDSNTSSPVKINFNNSVNNKNMDTITIQLEKYNQYGQVYDYYDLIYTNNTETSSIYTVNTISIDKHDKRVYPSNTLTFQPEIVTNSPQYLKSNFVKSL